MCRHIDLGMQRVRHMTRNYSGRGRWRPKPGDPCGGKEIRVKCSSSSAPPSRTSAWIDPFSTRYSDGLLTARDPWHAGMIQFVAITMRWSWPFGKRYHVRCPDGSEKTVYRNIDDAFPLSIHGWKGDLAAEGRGIAGETAKLKGAYATKVQGLLFGLDELTQTLMLNFRSVYIVYISDPCGNAGFLLREVEKLVAEQQRVARLRIQVRTLLDLAKAKPMTQVHFSISSKILLVTSAALVFRPPPRWRS